MDRHLLTIPGVGDLPDLQIAFTRADGVFELVDAPQAPIGSGLGGHVLEDIFRRTFWEARVLLRDTAALNYSVYPVVAPTGASYPGHVKPALYENVTRELTEGRGFAVRESTLLQGLSVWWLATDHGKGVTFELPSGRVVHSEPARIDGFENMVSDRRSDVTVHVSLLPYAALEEEAEMCGSRRLRIGMDGEAFCGSAEFDIAMRAVISCDARWKPGHHPSRESGRRLEKSALIARITLGLFPQTTVNNEPIEVRAVRDMPGVRVGETKRDLWLMNRAYSIVSSPTIHSFAVFTIEAAGAPSCPAEVEADVDGKPCRAFTSGMGGFYGTVSQFRTDHSIRLVQVPFESVAEALDDVPVEASAVTS